MIFGVGTDAGARAHELFRQNKFILFYHLLVNFDYI